VCVRVRKEEQNQGSRNSLQQEQRAPLAVNPVLAHQWLSLTNRHCWFSRDRIKRTGIQSKGRVTLHPAQPKAPRGPAALPSLDRAQTSKCLHRKTINT